MGTDTAIIACAGRGSRLGHTIPKSCVEVGSKTLLQWQLEALEDFRHIVIVVGYRRHYVIDELFANRTNAIIVINEDWEKTNTAYSISLGCALYDPDKTILTIDGDTLFRKRDIQKMLNRKRAIGVTTSVSEQGVFVKINSDNHATEFTRDYNTGFEWTGMAMIPAGIFHHHPDCYVFQVIEKYLPIQSQEINLIEIDTPEDLDRARDWVKSAVQVNLVFAIEQLSWHPNFTLKCRRKAGFDISYQMPYHSHKYNSLNAFLTHLKQNLLDIFVFDWGFRLWGKQILRDWRRFTGIV